MRCKKCVVPHCSNTSIKTPGKLFLNVPKNEKTRKLWLELARRDPNEIAVTSVVHFCEDHFDLERDVENYTQFKYGFSKRLLLVKGVLPSKFHCQQDHRKRLRDCATSRPASAKREKKGGNKRKKLPQSEDDGGDNVDSILHQMLAKPQEVMINEEIIVKQEVEPDIDDLMDAGRQQDLEYVPVKEEPTEDPDESTCSATEETREQMGRDQELPLIIKEEIDCDNYVDPFHIPQEAYLQ